ncbi:MAG: flagellar motor protein MotB [Spirochaetes bacterium]|nr:flagellar motor protein MotB [Brevinematales bacterium]MCL1959410.1 flagellar motor protein MotB [Spirochaetota bacterium]
MAKKKKQDEPTPSTWLNTYSDMITLCLCFFVILFNPDEVTQAQLDAIAEAIRTGGIGAMAGGLTLSAGRSAELGNTIMALPSMERGRVMGTAMRKAISVFSPEIRSNKVRITHDERGLVITLAGDALFNPASARINIEATRDMLMRLATYLSSDELRERKFRIEGHTDAVDIDPTGPWEDNWQLSSERSRAVLRYLTALGVDERRFQIAGFADTVPLATNETEEGRAINRRVDVVIIDEGHL